MSTSTLAQVLIYTFAVVILAVLAAKVARMSRAQGYRFGHDSGVP